MAAAPKSFGQASRFGNTVKSPSFAGRAVIDQQRPFRGRRRRAPFTPYVPSKRPPPGWYDPTLDANERAAGRGLQDFRQDTDRGQERADADYALGRGSINRTAGRSLADLLRERSRTGQDVGIAQQALDRRYQLQGEAQTQAGNAAGVLGGGFLAAAARKRAANKGIDQSALDLSASRAAEDSATTEGRVTQDKGLALADLGLGYSRGNQDRSTALSRAQRENTFFGQDTGAQRSYEAAQAGYIPPGRARGEHRSGGVVWRDQPGGGYRLPSGRVISGAELARRLRRRNG